MTSLRAQAASRQSSKVNFHFALDLHCPCTKVLNLEVYWPNEVTESFVARDQFGYKRGITNYILTT